MKEGEGSTVAAGSPAASVSGPAKATPAGQPVPQPLAAFPPGADEEIEELRAKLRASHPSFVRIDEVLMELAADPTVSPYVMDLCCQAVFTALEAYVEAKAE